MKNKQKFRIPSMLKPEAPKFKLESGMVIETDIGNFFTVVLKENGNNSVFLIDERGEILTTGDLIVPDLWEGEHIQVGTTIFGDYDREEPMFTIRHITHSDEANISAVYQDEKEPKEVVDFSEKIVEDAMGEALRQVERASGKRKDDTYIYANSGEEPHNKNLKY